VRVPDRHDLVHSARRAVLVERGEDRRVALVAEAVQLGAQVTAEAGVEGAGRFELAQHLEVEVEAPGRVVDDGELASLDLGRPVETAEQPVAGELDRELHPLASTRAREHGRVRALVRLRSVQALHRPAVDPERRLGAGRPEQLDAPPGPALRHRCRQAEPVGRPERAEAFTGLRRPVVERTGLLVGDAVDGPRQEQLVRGDRLRPDRLAEAHAGRREPLARVLGVPDQAVAAATPRSRLSPVSGEK
jgi:hypothetical protein